VSNYCAIDPRTFTTKDYQIEGDFIPKKLENKISQQIVHLTHERTDVDNDKLSDKERKDTWDYIEVQIERFERSIKPDWLPTWQDGLRKFIFEEPTGSIETFHYASGPTGPSNPPHVNVPKGSVAGPTNSVQVISSILGRKRGE